MKAFDYTIKDELGIHARPAGLLVKAAKATGSKVTLEKAGKSVDVTKLLMLMGLGVKKGDTVKITVEGGDEDASLKAMQEFMEANL